MIYAIFRATITNPDSMARYREVAGPVLEKHGGRVEKMSREAEALDGTPDIPSMIAVMSFPDAEAARAWIADPDHADVHALRRGAGRTDITLLV
ncbi:DUF1330 domain-containing protein [Chachezhania sediminis]|uniref:DUF1330 domain-containing protein n=1 Tax=Chachezhania sediminis TaxID=2599291 RepID=UPI00131B6486|nr:DUF1330 domain-containing protein [Chachezhania sediminis]